MENKNDKIWQYVENGKLQMEKVIGTYSNYVCKIIRNSYLKTSNEDLEEITLDVFLTLWKNQNKLDLNKSMSSYIAGITKNLIKKKYRDIKLNYNIEDYDEQIIEINSFELGLYQKEKNEIVISELNKMKQEDKDIFILYYYENKKLKEIAKMLEISESKAKVKLHRVRKRLKIVLKEGGYVEDEQ